MDLSWRYEPLYCELCTIKVLRPVMEQASNERMDAMHLRFQHPALIGAVLFSLLVFVAIPAVAAPSQHSRVNPAALAASPHHTVVHVKANPHLPGFVTDID